MTTVEATILGRSYKLACQDNDVPDLKRAIAHVEEAINQVKQAGKVKEPDRIAVFVAIRIAGELLNQQNLTKEGAQPLTDAAPSLIAAMREKLEAALRPPPSR